MSDEVPCCFAIVADDQEQPTAAFQHLEDALDWAVLRFGSNRFQVRHLRLVAMPQGEALHASGN
jgi:predicted alpha/beta hydrolase